MLKWLLVGWVCTGVGEQQACLRMASEVIHDDLNPVNNIMALFIRT